MKPILDPPKQATSGDLPEIAALLALVFPDRQGWQATLEWEYVANPSGRAWFVNARAEDGTVIAHYAVMALPRLDDPRFDMLPVYFPLNTAVRPGNTVPGLMVATARALFQHLHAMHPMVMLGVGNENAFLGLNKLLGFQHLGPLSLRFYPPWQLPPAGPPRALRADPAFLKWRVARPGARTFLARSSGAILRRASHLGIPLDGVLTVGLPVAGLRDLPPRSRPISPAALRLYASFGHAPAGGLEVPQRLRPSPLHYVFRVLAAGVDGVGVGEYLRARRFEFLDFDVM